MRAALTVALCLLGCDDDTRSAPEPDARVGADAAADLDAGAIPDAAVEADTAVEADAADAAADIDAGPDPALDDGPLTFPEGFLFGTAIAGFQVEMGCPTLPAEQCEDRNSDWYAFITAPETVESPNAFITGDPPSTGPGFWELYEADLDRAANELNNDAFRMSLEWSRIFPVATDAATTHEELRALADLDALERYRDIIAAVRARGMTPLVTLNHYTLPSWIHDGVGCHVDFENCSPRGWVDRERTVREVAKYSGFVARELGDQVDLWVTLNEPFALLLPGYILPNAERTNPPAVTLKIPAALEVLQALVEAHARMYDAVHANDDTAQVGVVYNLTPAKPAVAGDPLDEQAAKNFFYLWNEVYLNAVVFGRFDHDLDGEGELRDDLVGRMDYLGINYYTRVTVDGIDRSAFPMLSPLLTFNPLNLVLWEDYPRGLYEMAKYTHETLGLPSYVTENGTMGPEGRASFAVRHLTWVARAVRDGFDVRGFFFWTLVDNYEWNHGFGLKFGLYELDPETKARERRPVAEAYGRIAGERRIPAELGEEFPAP